MQDLIALSGGAPASMLILATIVIASLYALFVSPSIIDRHVFRPHGWAARGEYLTVVTSGFLHADLGHLLFNGFTFFAFGFGLERAIGSTAFALLYAFGLLASGAGTWLMHRREPGYRTLGASGAILAVLFASIVHFPTASLFILPIPVPIPAPLFALGYLAFTWYASRQRRGRVNHDAHLSGALAGLLFVALQDPAAYGRALRMIGA